MPEIRQLPLEFGHLPGASRDDLAVSPANEAALALVESWPGWASQIALLAGPPGSGKSHIAAIWQKKSGAERLTAGALPQSVEPGQAFLLEDFDRSRRDENALFHLINSVRASGGYLLLTARSFPAAWGLGLPDLLSRLKAATTVEIGEPDDALLSAVMAKLFADRQIAVEPQVISYLIHRIERSLSTAARVVDKLDREALARQTRITRVLAGEVLSALDAGQGELGF